MTIVSPSARCDFAFWVMWFIVILTGDVPSPLDLPGGCRFRARCPAVMEQCAQAEPDFHEVEDEHWVACWLAG